MNINLQGMGVALVTPFTKSGEVDYPGLKRLTDRLLGHVDYLVALGTTGEPSTLSTEEQTAVAQSIIEAVADRVPVILGVGGNCTQTVVHRLKTGDFSGISAILSVVPYYNKPSQEGIYQHYKCLAEVSPLPLILYNVPARTGVNMTAETTLRLARECPNIVATKEASGDLEQIKQILRDRPAGFQVVSGDDAVAVESIEAGAVGLISVLGNAFPRQLKEMVGLALAGDITHALSLQHRFADLLELIFAEGNPAGIKCLLHLMGVIENELRLPLVAVSAGGCGKIGRAVSEL